MKNLFLIIFILFTSVGIIKSQTQIYNLTLDQSIEIAKSQSLSMKRLEQDLKIAEYNLKSATSRLKTHIDLSFKLPEYTETVRQYEDSTGVSFYPIKQLGYSTNLTINQPLPTDGNIFIETSLGGLNDYYTDIRSTNLNARVGFRQPLDAFYGYNSIKATLKRAELAYEQSNKSLKREELNLIYQVSSSYYNLLSSQKSTDFAVLDLERQTEAYEISKNKFEAGLIREVDALQMEVDLAEAQNNYDIAIVGQLSAANLFKELIGINIGDSVVLNSELKYEPLIIDTELAVGFAKENRLELREREIQIALQELSIKQQKAQGMVRANINGYFEKVGVSRIDIGQSLSSSIDKSYRDFRHRPSNYGIGLTITIPILDWGENRALVRAEKARQKQLIIQRDELERNIETEVRNLVANLNSNLKRLQLLEKNVNVAEKSFEITLKRFADGDIDSQSLALERNRLNNAYNSHLRAYINYQLSIADLTRKTFYDFKSGRIIE